MWNASRSWLLVAALEGLVVEGSVAGGVVEELAALVGEGFTRAYGQELSVEVVCPQGVVRAAVVRAAAGVGERSMILEPAQHPSARAVTSSGESSPMADGALTAGAPASIAIRRAALTSTGSFGSSGVPLRRRRSPEARAAPAANAPRTGRAFAGALAGETAGVATVLVVAVCVVAFLGVAFFDPDFFGADFDVGGVA